MRREYLPGTRPNAGTPVRSLKRLKQTSTIELLAEELRKRIVDGYFPPGTQLSEEALGAALDVSRNTLREAFRLLCHEKLAVHRPNQGVFVRTLTADDIKDVYLLRTIIECAALDSVRLDTSAAFDSLAAAVREGEKAAARGDWKAVGTADMRFHEAIASLASSSRINELMKGILAETRLAFHAIPDPQQLHEPYLSWNGNILELLKAGQLEAAKQALVQYLRCAERFVLDGFQLAAAQSPPGRRKPAASRTTHAPD